MKPRKTLEQLTAEAIKRGREAIANKTATSGGQQARRIKEAHERGKAELERIAKVFPPVKAMLQ